MYERITYEALLQRMLNRVPNTMDKREGSIIYDALAPAAVELQNMYIELDVILNETFADTASRTYLIKRAKERGINPDEATYAILKGIFNIDIPIGSRFSLDNLNYIATEKISTGVYKLQCEKSGIIGNSNFGTLIPIEYIKGLSSAELTELLIPGENEEDTEVFRKKYFASFNPEAFGGNIADYKEKVKKIQGIGGIKVYPVWNGGGTVKLVILNSEFKKPTLELIDLVQTTVDPVQNHGEGLGTAPIGHVVTVEGVQEESVDITLNLTYQNGGSWDIVKLRALEEVNKYLGELNQTWENSEHIIIRVSQIESRLLEIPEILDISNTKINNIEANFNLGQNSIAVRGEVNGENN
ncbi:baseplate J-like protein [Clostridium puniceum]|uniref:Baseplate J-like protein n=1 Tax=Clostridium puniceum TaxID=29367 RepID=A0A1S8TX54_9CLOT|nr:baseplate J/gp47 family protein [Clostridium puniceum]OOM82338.1 baseplate J-like protein [Clostridium puniceum]